MSSIERDLNEYLFYEFGEEGDLSSVSETWPFRLRPIGNIEGRMVYEFDADEPFFALAEPSFDLVIKSGMSVDDLALHFIGSDWIRDQSPVSLEESRPGDESVPSGLERRRMLEELGRQATGDPGATVLEGLFLRRGARYLGLFGVPNESEAVIGGLDTPLRVGHAGASPWRRLAWGVGQWIRSKRLDQDAG